MWGTFLCSGEGAAAKVAVHSAQIACRHPKVAVGFFCHVKVPRTPLKKEKWGNGSSRFSFWWSFFQKAPAGVGRRAPRTRHFFFAKLFSLCLFAQRKKRQRIRPHKRRAAILRKCLCPPFLYRINERKRRKIRKNVKKQSIFLLTGGLKSDIMGVPLSEGSFFALKSKKSS